MSNALYSFDRVKFINGQFNWETLAVRLDAWRGPYVFNEAHNTVAQIIAAGGEKVVEGLPLTGKLPGPGGYAMSHLALLPTVPAGPPVTFLVMMEGINPLLYIDEAEGLPFTPNGLDQPVQPDWLHVRGWFRA